MQKTRAELASKFGRSREGDVDDANKTFHHSKLEKISSEWDKFAARFPDTDCVYEHFRKVGWDKYHIPLRDSLFSYLDEAVSLFQKEDNAVCSHFNTNTGQPPVRSLTSESALRNLPQQIASHSVRWHHFGVPMPTMPKRLDIPSGLVMGRDPIPTQTELRQAQLLKSGRNYIECNVDTLKSILRERQLAVSGKKATLISRLQAHDLANTAAAAPHVSAK